MYRVVQGRACQTLSSLPRPMESCKNLSGGEDLPNPAACYLVRAQRERPGQPEAAPFGTDEAHRSIFILITPKSQPHLDCDNLEENLVEERKLPPFFKMFSEFGNVELRIAPSELQKKYTFHFVVIYKDCYRFESNKELPAATVAFGDLARAGHLSGIYDRLWNESVPAHMIPEA